MCQVAQEKTSFLLLNRLFFCCNERVNQNELITLALTKKTMCKHDNQNSTHSNTKIRSGRPVSQVAVTFCLQMFEGN